MEDQEIVREFLIESNENLAQLDQDMVELEKHPRDPLLLGSVFRTIHTIKGTCGFLGYSTLEAVTHNAENVLSRVRAGELELTPAIVTAVLRTVDAVRKILISVEATGEEGSETFDDVNAALKAVGEPRVQAPPIPPTPESAPVVCETPVAPPPQTQVPPEIAPVAKSAAAESTIRVDVGLLDTVMTLVGELVLVRNQILQVTTHEDAVLNETSQRLNLITSELQEKVMRTRMQPIGMVWNKLPRLVRDLATASGKHIRVDMDGVETEVDKTIIEAIKDPLTHVVRNSCDHGIETPETRLSKGKPAEGTLSLRAFHEGGYVNIEVRDDGAGVNAARVKQKAIERGLLRADHADRLTDKEAANLVFLPGFSTAEKVSNISGRGVGMDVVKTNIEKIGGSVELCSSSSGATIRMKIPLTLAIIPGLVVQSGGERFAIPQVALVELVRLEGDLLQTSIEHVYGATVYRCRGRLLPIVYLNQLLQLPEGLSEPDAVNIVVLQADGRQFGLVVDGISDTQEIVVKPLGKQLKGSSCYAGATIMGDGKVALILDVMGIATLAEVLGENRETDAASEVQDGGVLAADRQELLLFRVGSFGRLSMPLSQVARLEEIPISRIERAGDRRVVQYREQILPLISLSEILNCPGNPENDNDVLQVVVVTNGRNSLGLVVDEIVDIVDDRLGEITRTGRNGLLGAAVVGGRMTDLIDLHGIVQQADPTWFEERAVAGTRSVLLANESPYARGMLRSTLEAAGYRVVEAGSVNEVLTSLSGTPVNAALLGSGLLAGEGAMQIASAMKAARGVPVIALGAASQAGDDTRWIGAWHTVSDREAMLRSLENLIEAVNRKSAPVPVEVN